METAKGEQNNFTRIIFLVASLLLLLYVVVRAYHLSFTHDESLTYQTVRGLPDFKDTANNHLLNTYLVKLTAALFGFSELALRLPNVLAFGLYLYVLYQLFARARALTLLALPFLLLNPFVLEFFSLCRGYGLAMALFAGSLYYFVQHTTARNPRHLAYALAAGVLCVYANFSFLTAILALNLSALLLGFMRKQLDARTIKRYYLPELLALVPALISIKHLQGDGQLYYGGENGLVEDSLYSIISYSFSVNLLDDTRVLVLAAAGLLCLFALLLKKSEGLKYALLSLAFTLGLPVLLHALVGMKFPIDRSVLYLPVLLGFGAYYAAESAAAASYKSARYPLLLVLAALGLLHVVNFYTVANITYTSIWPYDAHTREVLATLQSRVDPKKKYSLGCTWVFEPTLNYYRETKGYAWLLPVFRHNYSADNSYYYVMGDDTEFKPGPCQAEIKKFPQSNSTLLYRVQGCPDQ